MTAILLICLAVNVDTIPVTFPKVDEKVIYGPGKSLLGCVRYWNPAYFYPLHPSLRPYIAQYDRELLNDRYRLEKYLTANKAGRFIHTDTFYVNMPESAFKTLLK
jgi:hypothetical protein